MVVGHSAIGWRVLEPDQLTTCTVEVQGGYAVTMHVRPGDTCDVLMDLVTRFDRTVERLDLPGERDEWSYAKRRVRQSSNIWSEHSAGTALDLNATRHPRGSRGTFSRSQVKQIRALLAFYERLVAWGGDFKTVTDEMHFEITKPPGHPLVARIAEKCRMAAEHEMEDDMPTAQEIAEAVYQTFTHKTFTSDKEGGIQLDNRAPVQIALVGARASLSTQDIARRTLTAVGELKELVKLIAAQGADDATKAQVQEVSDKIDQLLVLPPEPELPELPKA